MKHTRTDILAELQFLKTEDGGRKSPIVRPVFGCIFEHSGEAHDCGIVLENHGDVWPGQKITVPIFFLRPDTVMDRLRVGDSFSLREDRVIATGSILQIADSD